MIFQLENVYRTQQPQDGQRTRGNLKKKPSVYQVANLRQAWSLCWLKLNTFWTLLKNMKHPDFLFLNAKMPISAGRWTFLKPQNPLRNRIGNDRFILISVQWKLWHHLSQTPRCSSHEDQHYYCQAWFGAICYKESTIGMQTAKVIEYRKNLPVFQISKKNLNLIISTRK